MELVNWSKVEEITLRRQVLKMPGTDSADKNTVEINNRQKFFRKKMDSCEEFFGGFPSEGEGNNVSSFNGRGQVLGK